MTTSCQRLAQRYATETGKAIPGNDASTQVKSDWLLTQTWGCILPGKTEFHTNENGFCSQYNNPSAPAVVKPDADGKNGVTPSTALVRPPMLNYLKEEGFLSWVNQRGLQCVNRIVGNFYGFNNQTGSANIPSVSVSPPDSQCWGACFQVTSTSDMCFECVNQVLKSNPKACPQLNPNDPNDETLIQDSVNCHECIGTQGTFIPLTSTTPNETAMIDNMWKCITGSVSPGLTTSDIVIIAIACVFFAAIVIVLAVYFAVIHPKILKKERERQQIMAAGYSPDEL